MVNSVSVGVIGVGRFGSKVLAAVRDLDSVNLLWTADSKTNWWELEIPDWTLVCTPHGFHYEQAKFFLEKGGNVFVEKPATLSVDALHHLIELAKANQALLYVDDVYAWSRSQLSEYTTHHYRTTNEESNVFDLIAYHYFYLLYYSERPVGDPKIQFASRQGSRVQFSLEFEKQGVFHFDFDSDNQEKIVSTEFLHEGNPLKEMLTSVINGKANYVHNIDAAIFATKISSILRKFFFESIAVVGGGIYGVSCAESLALAGYSVTLFEQKQDLMLGATAVNQYRIHKGFHYPRSPETIEECQLSFDHFVRRYGQAIVHDYDHFYAVAKEGTRTSSQKYLEVMNEASLDFEIVETVNNCSLTVLTEETSFSPNQLRKLSRERLFGAGVKIVTNSNQHSQNLEEFDSRVFATYRDLNNLRENATPLKYQIVEKIAVRVPTKFQNKSLVVMDGPYFSIDPHPDFDFHVVGAVEAANHSVQEGLQIDLDFAPWNLDTGELDPSPATSRKDEIMDLARYYLNFEMTYVGSFFVTKTLQTKKEKTDERRFSIYEDDVNANFYLLGGKISASSLASKELVKRIRSKR